MDPKEINQKEVKFSRDLIKILIKSMESQIYGSVEIYFEAGQVTQITQRIINKVEKKNKKAKIAKVDLNPNSLASQ